MLAPTGMVFGPYRLDPRDRSVFRDGKPIVLSTYWRCTS